MLHRTILSLPDSIYIALELPQWNQKQGTPTTIFQIRCGKFSRRFLPRHILTFSRLMTYIYMSFRTANPQMLHFIYLFNKYKYWIF